MKKTLFGLVVSALMYTGAVNAGSIDYFFGGAVTQLSDNSAEYLVKGDNNTNPDNATILEVGDRLVGIFNINSTENISVGGDQVVLEANGYDELSGVFDITVASKTADGSDWVFTFAPTAGGTFEQDYGTGAMVAFYTDPVYEYTRTGSAADTVDTLAGLITDGSLFMVTGFDGGGNEFWISQADTDDISVLAAIPAPGIGGGYNAGLDLLVNNTGREFHDYYCLNPVTQTYIPVDQCGSGSLLGIAYVDPVTGELLQIATPFDSFDNLDFTMTAKVPEPSIVLMFGTGLLVMGGLARRRRAKA